MNQEKFEANLLELIRRTSAFLPPDVQQSITARMAAEQPGSLADFALDLVAQNIGLAKHLSMPICQDTGTVSFYLKVPVGVNQVKLNQMINTAVARATEIGYLRQNSVDSLTGKNTGNNLGDGHPAIHFEQWESDTLDVRLVLKGGGCENVGAQYKLPAEFCGRKFGRDLAGVRACVLDAVLQAQGHGCGPGYLGVCIGGDRAMGYAWAKHQLLREVDDTNPVPELAILEERILAEANQTGIGPMGFGGKFTVGGCKIGAQNRLPASFFVTIAYMCWAFRRRGFILSREGDVIEWLYQSPGEFDGKTDFPDSFTVPSAGVKILNSPPTETEIRALKVGDRVLIHGTIFTGRDAVHKYLYDGGELEQLKGGIIYHCGPVVLEEKNQYQVLAAGPTTSIREEPYQAEIIKKFGIKAVIGKGGMGAKTLQACQEHGAVYLHAIGGAAQIYARCVTAVPGVSLKQFGSPEAVWEFRVAGFPAVVTMDTHGNSLHQKVLQHSREKLSALL
jgi:fumarate hydratase class I